MKKSIILSFVGAALFFCHTAKSSAPDRITLTWAGDPHTTQTITWRTDNTEAVGEVQYTAAEDSANFAAKKMDVKEDSSGKYKTDIESWYIHTLTLKNLKPGKTYCYRVGYGNSWSARSTFTTESTDTKNFRFLIFGDSQSGNPLDPNYKVFGITIHNAYKANPSSAFFINVGDLVEVGGDNKHWNNWFDAVNGVINNIPFMPVVGNHDTYTTLGGLGKPVSFIRQFNVPQQNVPDGFKGQIYSYDYGNVHFAVWDSQIQEEKPDKAMLNKELDWLRKDLKNTDRIWKVVLFHKTPYYTKISRSNDTLKAMLQPIFDSAHVDLVVNGHDHGVSWTYPIKNDNLKSKPSQGTVYYLAGRSGNKSYNDLVPKVWNAGFYDPQDMPNYVVADVNASQFKLVAYKQDMTPVDTFIIDKAKDEIFPLKVPVKFKETKLVLYGKAMSDTVKVLNMDNVWYIPATAFVEYLHGKSDKNADGLQLKVKKRTGEFTVKHFPQSKNIDMISAEDIRAKLGFKYHYDEAMNMLLFSKD